MARYHFPGKPAKCSWRNRARCQRVATSRLPCSRVKLVIADNTGHWLDLFNSLFPTDSEEDEFRGFTDREIREARSRYEELAREGDICRAELWAARGVQLVPHDRDRIRQQAAEVLRSVLQSSPSPSSQQPPPPLPAPTPVTPHRFKQPHPVPKKTPKSAPPKVHSRKTPTAATDQYSVRDRSERARHRTPILDRIIVDRGDRPGLLRGLDVKALRIRRKKAREIQIPGWRVSAASAAVGGSSNVVQAEEVERKQAALEESASREDTSDAAYIARHAKAEAEEQELWEKWQTMRRRAGKSGGGRSQSQAWRQIHHHHHHQPNKLRSDRLESLESECSSGRVSPATMASITEICVATEPPSPEAVSPSSSPGGSSTGPATPAGESSTTASSDSDRIDGGGAPYTSESVMSPVGKGCSSGGARKRTLATADCPSAAAVLLNSEGGVLVAPHWLLNSPGRDGGGGAGGDRRDLLLAVSPPKMGPGHLAYKLFKKCPTPPLPAAELRGSGSGVEQGNFLSDQEDEADRAAAGGGVVQHEVITDSDAEYDSRRVNGNETQLPTSDQLSTRTRRKSQLGAPAALLVLKRSRSNMRGQEMSLPLTSTSNSSLLFAKENCDNGGDGSAETNHRATSPATAVAVPVMPVISCSVRPEEQQLDAVPDSISSSSSSVEIPSRVLRDKNLAEKGSMDTWHRPRTKGCNSSSRSMPGTPTTTTTNTTITITTSPQKQQNHHLHHHKQQHHHAGYPLRSQSITRRTRQGGRR